MKLKQFVAGACALAMLATVAGCSSDDTTTETTESTTTTTTTATETTTSVDVPDIDVDAVAYTVGDYEFTVADYVSSYAFNRAMMDLNLSSYGMTMDDLLTEDETGASYLEQLHLMAQEQLVYLAAMDDHYAQAGFTALADDEVATEVALVMASYESEEAFYAELVGMGMTEEAFNDLMAGEMQSVALEEYYLGEGGAYALDDAEVRAYFDENYLRAKHVLISTIDDTYTELENQDELEALAYEVAELAQSGEDFDTLIATYGEDPGSAYYPDGYVFTSGEMVDEFYNTTLALEENEISDPVMSYYGWHIIQRLPLTDEDYASMYDTVAANFYSFDDLYYEWAAEYTTQASDAIMALTDSELLALSASLAS